MKNNDANNNPKLIFVIAIIFIIGGLAGGIALALENIAENALFFGICILLFACGIFFFIFAIKRTKELKILKSIQTNPNAYQTTAKFIKAKISGYTSKSIGINNVNIPTSVNVFKKVIYEYKDEHGVTHTAKSTLSYFPNQVKYLEEKGEFKIKCQGANSVIIEELPESNSRYNIG